MCAIPIVAWAADGGAKAGIAAGNKAFEEGVAKGDAAAVAKVYASDGEIMPPGAPVVKGREAIQKALGGMLGPGFKKISLKTVEVHPMGNLALEVSSWHSEDASGKGTDGKGLVLWKKNGSTWQIYRDIWNDNTSPEPAKPAPAVVAPPATK
ncbi:MAG: YybH family protein [Myxococcaceae bacterium]